MSFASESAVCYNTNKIQTKKTERKTWHMKIMGIDYGDARTGVSISDPTGFLAGSPQVISTWNTEKLLDDLTALVQKKKLKKLSWVCRKI